MRRVGMHVENENLATLQAGEPELAPVIGETAVVRLVLSGHRGAVNHFAIIGRTGLDIHNNQFV